MSWAHLTLPQKVLVAPMLVGVFSVAAAILLVGVAMIPIELARLLVAAIRSRRRGSSSSSSSS